MRQILPHSPLAEDIDELRKFRHRLESYDGSGFCSIYILFLTKFAASFADSPLYIILDGLDECAKRSDLLDLLRNFSLPNLHILVTSRPEADIEEVFTGEAQLHMDETRVRSDIYTHIEWRLDNDERLKFIKPKLKDEIKETLIAKSAGM